MITDRKESMKIHLPFFQISMVFFSLLGSCKKLFPHIIEWSTIERVLTDFSNGKKTVEKNVTKNYQYSHINKRMYNNTTEKAAKTKKHIQLLQYIKYSTPTLYIHLL